MFETQTNKQGWNGIFKNVKQATQTFVWMLEALAADGKVYKKEGSLFCLDKFEKIKSVFKKYNSKIFYLSKNEYFCN